MEINREMVLLYALGKVHDPNDRALIEERIANDAEVAGWLEQLRGLGDPQSGDDEVVVDLDERTTDNLRHFFPNSFRSSDAFVQLARPLEVPYRSGVGAAASTKKTTTGAFSKAIPGYAIDVRRQQLHLYCPESMASFEYGVAVAAIYSSRADMDVGEAPLATAVFAVQEVDGVYEKWIAINSIRPGLVVDAKVRVRFSGDADDILAASSLEQLEEIRESDEIDPQRRDRFQELVARKKSRPIS